MLGTVVKVGAVVYGVYATPKLVRMGINLKKMDTIFKEIRKVRSELDTPRFFTAEGYVHKEEEFSILMGEYLAYQNDFRSDGNKLTPFTLFTQNGKKGFFDYSPV